MQSTLQQLQHDLAFHVKRRIEAEREAGGHLASAPRPRPSSDSESVTPLRAETTAAQQRRMADPDVLSEAARIQRARAAAADEGLSDDQSVEDYGVDCEVPPLTSDSRLVDEVAAIAVCMAKMKESAKVMYDTEATAPSTSTAPWWSSALHMRDMKASAARLDYHAHTALNWSHRSMEQLLLQAVMLNNVSVSTRTQLLEQQQHWQEFQTRLRDGQQTVTQLQADIARYQARVQAEMARRAALQEELRLCAQERGLVDPGERNPLKAELALLLEEREWPSPTLKKDASVVLDWLRSVSTTLE
ncbi:Heat_shock_protein_100_kDa [Leishmania infantum]|uniref:Heat_shock_protein_100_kDa n=2 Tax=Leishmania donovani species complex TaxID=38574 RepID=A0A6L0XIN8_LEIIN|nr:Heat_shock_protein_100_kDa [Leishmania infantum]SUZ43158.1 Heat_shock_protein_100_kDa [Leishmania infantum]